jgi:hypothetical protein
MDKNIYTNKELFSYHFDIKKKERRLNDFEKIYNILKFHIEPTSKAKINETKIKDYINLYKNENKEFIKRVLHCINHIEYIFIFGVNNQIGSSNLDFNLYKSNLWMILLIWDKLLIKPIDIILNIKIAIQLYGDSVEYLIVDDCSYSGSQIVDQVLYSDASESLYKYPSSFLIRNNVYNKSMFKPVQKHNIKIHLFIPYLSWIAWNKINELKLLTCFDIILYEKYILNEYNILLSDKDSSKLNKLYSNIYKDYNPLKLIPIFFDHKIADGMSTIELILTKGQVLDDYDKKLIFVEPCDKLYDNMLDENKKKILYCPIPPYHKFKKILEENL